MNWKENFPKENIYYEEENGIIYCGDALAMLKKFPDESVDMVITSPPYFSLRDYKVEGQIGLESSFEEYLEKLLKITAELKRILKKSGSLWWNHGDSYGGSLQGYGAKKPSETGFQKPAGIDERYSKEKPPLAKMKPKCLLMQPERLAIKMIDEQGWTLRQKIVWAKQVLINKENRTIGSTMPTSVKDRFNMSWEYLYHFVKSKKYYFDLDSVRIPAQTFLETKFNIRVRDAERKVEQPGYREAKKEIEKYRNAAYDWSKRKESLDPFQWRSRAVKYQTNPDPRGNDKGGPGSFILWKDKHRYYHSQLGRNIPTIWQINPEPHNFKRELGVETEHFAHFPTELVRIPILSSCPPDGIVLDPFNGSGTTCFVAKRLGRKFIGIDLNSGYCEISKRRLQKENNPLNLL